MAEKFKPKIAWNTEDAARLRPPKSNYLPDEPAGYFPDISNVAYKGFKVKMTPYEFRKLAMHRSFGENERSLKWLKSHMQKGETIAPMMLDATYDPKTKEWNINGHEGRTRAEAMMRLGYNEPVEVAVYPSVRNRTSGRIKPPWRSHTVRAQYVTPEMVKDFLDKPIKTEGSGHVSMQMEKGYYKPDIKSLELLDKTYTPENIVNRGAIGALGKMPSMLSEDKTRTIYDTPLQPQDRNASLLRMMLAEKIAKQHTGSPMPKVDPLTNTAGPMPRIPPLDLRTPINVVPPMQVLR